jgi:NAD(P)H-hydrate epimerase
MTAISLDALPLVRDVPSVTAAHMAEVDRTTTDELGIGVELLMENASRQIAAAARAILGGRVAGKRIVALVGPGNNGADAIGALRHLVGWGARTRAVLSASRERARDVTVRQLDRLVASAVEPDLAEVTDAAGARAISDADLVLDGLLGYSARGAPRGAIADLIAAANDGGAPILAVDIPSGLDPDTGTAAGVAIRAAATVTLALPKRGLLRADARDRVGTLLLADIGIPHAAFAKIGVSTVAVFTDGDLVRVRV